VVKALAELSPAGLVGFLLEACAQVAFDNGSKDTGLREDLLAYADAEWFACREQAERELKGEAEPKAEPEAKPIPPPASPLEAMIDRACGVKPEEIAAEPEPIDPDLDGALRKALAAVKIGGRHFADEAEELTAGGATDAYLLGQVAQYFGIGGSGRHAGKAFHYHPGRESKEPGFWYGTPDRFRSSATLSGEELLAAVRRVFGIPVPEV
jgi:hypothetical protein